MIWIEDVKNLVLKNFIPEEDRFKRWLIYYLSKCLLSATTQSFST